MQSISQDVTPGALRRAIAKQRTLIRSLDRRIDRDRAVIDHAVNQLPEHVRQRDAAAVQLAHLIAWRDELAA